MHNRRAGEACLSTAQKARAANIKRLLGLTNPPLRLYFDYIAITCHPPAPPVHVVLDCPQPGIKRLELLHLLVMHRHQSVVTRLFVLQLLLYCASSCWRNRSRLFCSYAPYCTNLAANSFTGWQSTAPIPRSGHRAVFTFTRSSSDVSCAAISPLTLPSLTANVSFSRVSSAISSAAVLIWRCPAARYSARCSCPTASCPALPSPSPARPVH